MAAGELIGGDDGCGAAYPGVYVVPGLASCSETRCSCKAACLFRRIRMKTKASKAITARAKTPAPTPIPMVAPCDKPDELGSVRL